jgi:ParB family transcriptional regulator, chromosome partitioning protein
LLGFTSCSVRAVDVDLHQLELRHHDLRIHDAEQRRRLIGSVAEIGQQVPVIAIRETERLVLIDGYLRVEALRKLGRDTASATTWPLTDVDALLHRRHLSIAIPAIEDAWLLARLRDHGLTLDELARRLCRSKSWVSRRLALIEALTPAAHAQVRAGTVPPHAAMKYLVPLARANKQQCEQLIAGLGDTRVSDRELAALYDTWRCADRAGKQRIVAEPLLVLRALAATAIPDTEDASAPLHKDITMLAAIAWRASRRVRGGDRFTAELTRAWRAAREAFTSLGTTIEEMHAGPGPSTSHPDPA